jgi:hypothetical protein
MGWANKKEASPVYIFTNVILYKMSRQYLSSEQKEISGEFPVICRIAVEPCLTRKKTYANSYVNYLYYFPIGSKRSTNRASVRVITPVAPAGPRSCSLDVVEVPAMSRWTQGVPSANSPIKAPATMA